MIHSAKVIFHNLDYFIFSRKQDAQQYQLQKQHQLLVMIDNHYLSFLVDNQNPLCKAKTRMIDFDVKQKGEANPPQIRQKQLTIYYIPPVKATGQYFHIKLATIISTKTSITSIRESLDKNRKYKSCLAFVPSRVKHISILSGESPTQRFRGFLNLMGIMFMILNLRNILDNFIRYGIMFGRTPTAFVPIDYMIALFLLALFPFNAFCLEKLKFKFLLAPALVKFLTFFNLVSLLAMNTLYCLLYKPSPLLNVLYTALAIIIQLKLISYYQVNHQLYGIIKRIEIKKQQSNQKSPKSKSKSPSKSKIIHRPSLHQKDVQQQIFTHYEISQQNLDEIALHEGHWQTIISLKKMYYFIALPTLCYQLIYPQTSSIRYVWLLKRIFQLILVVGFQAILWYQYIEPQLKQLLVQVHSIHTTWYALFYRHLRLAIPNTIMWIAGFYSVFHLWLNIMGEILYFGDRNFYRDWWNCRSLQEYWKTWNLPVHFWFIRHLYNPLLQVGVSKASANLLVFLISAIAHQYLVSVPLGLISCWAFLAMIMQAPIIFIQKKLDKFLRIQNSELSNVSFWLFFCIIGQPLVVFIYYAIYIDSITNTTGSPKIPAYIPIGIQL